MAVCYNYLKHINDMLDNEIAPSELKQLEEHLASCLDCRHYVEQAKSVKASFAALPRYKTSDTFDIVLRERLRNELKSEKKFSFTPVWDITGLFPKRVPVFAAAVAVVLITGFIFGRNIMLPGKQTPVMIVDQNDNVVRTVPAKTVNNEQVNDPQPSLKMTNYVNVREQFQITPELGRLSSKASQQRGRIESSDNRTDSIRNMRPMAPNMPLVRQANATVHF